MVFPRRQVSLGKSGCRDLALDPNVAQKRETAQAKHLGFTVPIRKYHGTRLYNCNLVSGSTFRRQNPPRAIVNA